MKFIQPARRLIGVAAFALAATTLSAPVLAADTETPANPRPAAAADPLGNARKLIAEKKWVAAIDELKRVNATRSADWNNLMGYSHRKARTPDLAAAARYYDAALRIDPNHKGALEYSGELALMQGDLAVAEQRLATLTKACGSSKCEELDDLKAAIASFKANGNKHVAKAD
jgi:tetratricopeptide (TPR) repeat protein